MRTIIAIREHEQIGARDYVGFRQINPNLGECGEPKTQVYGRIIFFRI